MRKKITASIITASLLLQPISSFATANIWDSNSILKNRTSSGIATDPASGTTYYRGGGIEVRFKRSGTFPPIFQLGAPSIKGDCASLSLDMGYAALINLQQLGKQLSQVGSSIVWGIVVGMVYTMPGINQAFKTINEWSDWLQRYMQNACSGSKAAGARLGTRLWGDYAEKANSVMDGWGPDDMLGKTPSIENMLDTIFQNGTPAQINGAKGSTIKQLFSEANGLASSYLNTLITSGAETVNFTDEPVEIKELSKIGLSTSSQMILYFILSLTDDVGILENNINALKGSLTDPKKLSKIVEGLKSGNTFTIPITKTEVSEKAFVSYFLNGVNTDGPFNKMPDIKVALFNIDNGNGYKDKFILLTNGTSQNVDIFHDWKGLIYQSKLTMVDVANKTLSELKKLQGNYISSSNADSVAVVYSPSYKLIRELVLDATSAIPALTMDSDGNITGPEELKDMVEYLSYKNALGLLGIALSSMELNVLGQSYSIKATETKENEQATKELESNSKQSLENKKTTRKHFTDAMKSLSEHISKKSVIIEEQQKMNNFIDQLKSKREKKDAQRIK